MRWGGYVVRPPPINNHNEIPRHQTQDFDIKKETISTTRKETSFGMERIHAVAYATFINLNVLIMKSLNCKVTVANVALFTTSEGRQMISFVINEQIPARRLDKTTGELVVGFANDIKMPLRQFAHIMFIETATMLQYYFAAKDSDAYKNIGQGNYYNLLVGATLDIKISRFEDGETFVNEIDGDEVTSDGVTFHTHINDIELSDFGNDFAFGEPKDMTKMVAIIKAAKQARGKKFDFATDKAAETAE